LHRRPGRGALVGDGCELSYLPRALYENPEWTVDLMGPILSNRSARDRSPVDLYETPDDVLDALVPHLAIPRREVVWECAAGPGRLARRLRDHGYLVGTDFLSARMDCAWIITNPPFSLAEAFIRHAIFLRRPFAFLLKSQFWHAARRRALFELHRPAEILALSWRPDFLFGAKGGAPTMECVWTVWDSTPARETLFDVLPRPKVENAG
jgi:hypothetical protein